MTNGRWRRARTTEVWEWGWAPRPGSPRQEQLDCWLLQGPGHRCLPLLPTGTRKGEEVEEKWAPAERVSE